ncbi:hypothetical protein [Phytohabitans rumicis]|uniref:Uncharacterized protein n=1 Tax=Phytohabitans rumicis TaxID=1076125 RepID=A0A6V8L220_9ACTN|nr:hypothetical protein [Phytohabitans rumicis]GFJ88851.1 hypothetical protein Prum_024930 [Phytohabitans rumicis]
MTDRIESLMTEFRTTAPAGFTAPPVEQITGAARHRSGRRTVVAVAALGAGVIAIAAAPVVLFGGGDGKERAPMPPAANRRRPRNRACRGASTWRRSAPGCRPSRSLARPGRPRVRAARWSSTATA